MIQILPSFNLYKPEKTDKYEKSDLKMCLIVILKMNKEFY